MLVFTAAENLLHAGGLVGTLHLFIKRQYGSKHGFK
jgi:hypothetical protein